MKRALWLAVVASLSCTFIPPHSDGGTRISLPDAGPKKGGGGTDGGGGSGPGWDGGGGIPDGWPGSGTAGDRGTDVLLLFRIDRGSGDLAPYYQQLTNDLQVALAKNAFRMNVVAAGDLYTGQLFWELGDGDSLEGAISTAAASAPLQAPATCTTAALLAHAPAISDWSFPDPTYPKNSLYPFASAPSVILVVLVDSAARPQPLDACGVNGVPLAQYLAGQDPEQWLLFSDGARPRLQVGLFTIATAEGVSDEVFRSNCRNTPGFPPGVLDQLAPSPAAFFPPLVDGIELTVPAVRFDLCSVIAGEWKTELQTDLGRWAKALQAR